MLVCTCTVDKILDYLCVSVPYDKAQFALLTKVCAQIEESQDDQDTREESHQV